MNSSGRCLWNNFIASFLGLAHVEKEQVGGRCFFVAVSRAPEKQLFIDAPHLFLSTKKYIQEYMVCLHQPGTKDYAFEKKDGRNKK